MKKIILSVLVLLAALSLTGCRTSNILNVPHQTVMTTKKALTNDDVFKAIVRAGASKGWIITRVNDNTATGTLNLRGHQAVVTITFNTKEYSITYKSSVNLKYNAEKNTIHSNYNGWVQNLKDAINVQLSLL
jgi:predicted small lipoprotein YifL